VCRLPEKLWVRRSTARMMDKIESPNPAIWDTTVSLRVVRELIAEAFLPLKTVPALLQRLVDIEERKVGILEVQNSQNRPRKIPVKGPGEGGRDRQQLQLPARIQNEGGKRCVRQHEKWTVEENKANQDYENIILQRRFPEKATKVKISYIKGDIVTASENIVIHLVGGNLRNSAGAARALGLKYGKPDSSVAKFGVGDIVIQGITGTDREIWHVVSKEKSKTKKYANPGAFYMNFIKALVAIRNKIQERGIKKVAMTKLGAGLDGISWKYTELKLKEIFKETEVEVIVFSLPKVVSFPGGGVGAAQGAETNHGRRHGNARHQGVAQGSVGGGCPLQPPTTSRPPDKPSTLRYENNIQRSDVTNAQSISEPISNNQSIIIEEEIQKEGSLEISTSLSGGGDNSKSPPLPSEPPRTMSSSKVMPEKISLEFHSQSSLDMLSHVENENNSTKVLKEGRVEKSTCLSMPNTENEPQDDPYSWKGSLYLTKRLSGGGSQSMLPLPLKEPPQTNLRNEVKSQYIDLSPNLSYSTPPSSPNLSRGGRSTSSPRRPHFHGNLSASLSSRLVSPHMQQVERPLQLCENGVTNTGLISHITQQTSTHSKNLPHVMPKIQS